MTLEEHFALPPQVVATLQKVYVADTEGGHRSWNLSKSLLFSGPPKIGKTLLMKTLLFELSIGLVERAEADGRLPDNHTEVVLVC